ncbi:MAG: histidine kinase dimerization/phosphoacceptor domain -containing protein [Sphingomonadaceae bacterium]
MHRLARYDVSQKFHSRTAKFAAEAGFGLICAAVMIGLRSAADLIAPTAGPFALVYPTVLVATLFGHWFAGMVAWGLSFGWAWYFVLPYAESFSFQIPSDPPRVVINLLASLIIILFAESFRRAVRYYGDAIEAAADRRLTLLAELEHRTKNNFALVASLLEIQKRRHSDERVTRALEDASGRVLTFADAYTNLAAEQEEGADVAMKPYLERLIERLTKASFGNNVRVRYSIAELTLPREQAVGVGLYLNEAIANCAKYAFPESRRGVLAIEFTVADYGWCLCVSDDGIGEEAISVDKAGGLGRNLMDIFAHQARATHHFDRDKAGCTVRLTALQGS